MEGEKLECQGQEHQEKRKLVLGGKIKTRASQTRSTETKAGSELLSSIGRLHLKKTMLRLIILC